MNKTLLIFCCLITILAKAQPEQNNWYFGNRAAISFETGKPVVKYDNPQKMYGPSASISHPVTGKLLFYTDGVNIWNNAHQVMENGGVISQGNIGRVMIVPDPVNDLRYYVFIGSYAVGRVLSYVVVDMNLNNGAGSVVKSPEIIRGYGLSGFVVVYHPYKKAFWIVRHTVSSFESLFFDETGKLAGYLLSNTGLVPKQYGDMVVNHKGDKLVVTHYQDNDEQAEVFDFDKVCGKVSNSRVLDKLPNWDRPYGAAFSPDDSKLYITYSYQQSQLIQYSGDNFENNYFVADAPDNFNILRTANDGKIYIATHNAGIPGPRIDAILKPDEIATGCGYTKTYLTTDDGTGRNANFELPAFPSGKPFEGPVLNDIFSFKGTCLGQPTDFEFDEKNPIDSLRWDFGDGTTDSKKETKHTYTTGGMFVVTLTLFKCGNAYPMVDTIRMDNPPEALFPEDTTVCFGSTLKLNGPSADAYLWSTGETAASINVKKPGLVWLRSTAGTCHGFDSIKVSYHPDIFTSLGDEYFICDDDQELVKLDAGEGFDQYKWTPTGDTSQWIIVGDLGRYFVVVKDFRGCDGNDGTKVQRRCPVSVFYPNVFTPNHDGINDVYLPVGTDVTAYTLVIYNAWGQKIFTSNLLEQGWDGTVNGKPAPTGTYLYQSTYSGYRNKLPVSFETNGNITLLR